MIDTFAYALLAAIIIGVICLTVHAIFKRVCATKEKNINRICGTVIATISLLLQGDYEIKKPKDEE